MFSGTSCSKQPNGRLHKNIAFLVIFIYLFNCLFTVGAFFLFVLSDRPKDRERERERERERGREREREREREGGGRVTDIQTETDKNRRAASTQRRWEHSELVRFDMST